MTDHILSLKNISKSYGKDEHALEVLKGLDLDVKKGELVALVGHSGSGKSTLLHIAGMLDQATSGDIIICDQDCKSLNDDQRTAIRRHEIGFIYQFHHLLPELSAVENVAVPLRLNGKSKKASEARAKEILESLSLAHRFDHNPTELSGGEQQRVAIARAFAIKPKLILADEPTGNLDPETAETVFHEFQRLAREENMSALIATHNLELAQKMDRTIILKSGQLVEE